MADDISKKIAEKIGPYEHWNYQGAGAAFHLWPNNNNANNEKITLISAMIETTSIICTDYIDCVNAIDSLTPDKNSNTINIPTLWIIDGGEIDQIPAIIIKNEPETGETTNRSINNILKSIPWRGGAALIMRMNQQHIPPDFSPGLRVNTPIPIDTFNWSFNWHKFYDDKMIAQQKALEDKTLDATSRTGNRQGRTIMAVIDDGIPFAHQNFREKHNKGTRIEYCWLQSAKAIDGGSVLFGKEINKNQIDQLLVGHNNDEDAVYDAVPMSSETLRYGNTLDRWGTHGSHIMDIAAGHDHNSPRLERELPNGQDDLDRLRLIGVQLPAPTTIDTVGFGKEMFILSAFHYIFDRTDALYREWGVTEGAQQPLIINFSYGFTGGPHDGTDRLESAISKLIELRNKQGKPTKLVMPAGNHFLDALHGQITNDVLDANRGFDIPWRIQPDDRSSNYLEIWLPHPDDGPTTQVENGGMREALKNSIISIIDPFGGILLKQDGLPQNFERDEYQDIRPILRDGTNIGQYSVDFFRKNRWRIMVILAPTTSNNSLALAPAGLWTIRLEAKANTKLPMPITCRIQRDNDPFGYSRGARQSYFDDPRDKKFDELGQKNVEDIKGAFVRRFGSLNGLATHGNVHVIGAYIDSSKEPAPYSSAGYEGETIAAPQAPTGQKQKFGGEVHAAAAGDTSVDMPGQLAAGTRSGTLFRMSGTSVAAPQVSREIACQYLMSFFSKNQITDRKNINNSNLNPKETIDKLPKTSLNLIKIESGDSLLIKEKKKKRGYKLGMRLENPT